MGVVWIDKETENDVGNDIKILDEKVGEKVMLMMKLMNQHVIN